jgi:mono/diheme cytochrome c family protein
VPPTPALRRYVAEVYPILEAKCIDCHHREVAPPWYAALPLLGPRVERDVRWGRQRLDLSRPYPFLDPEHAEALGGRAYLVALRTAVLDESMPPMLYRLTHPLSSLDADEERTLLGWVDEALAEWDRPGPEAALADRVSDVVRNRCARCHNEGVHDDMNGAFDFVSDLPFLAEDEDYVVAGDAEGSPLFERLVDGSDPMPPSPNDALSPDEIELVREWIDEGAETP